MKCVLGCQIKLLYHNMVGNFHRGYEMQDFRYEMQMGDFSTGLFCGIILTVML